MNIKIKIIIRRHLLQLVTIRQFPPADKSLPPLNKSKWWIPTATKVSIVFFFVLLCIILLHLLKFCLSCLRCWRSSMLPTTLAHRPW